MPSVQVVYNGPLVMTLLSASWAEQKAHLSFQSLGGVYALETHYFGEFEGLHCPEKWRSLADPLTAW